MNNENTPAAKGLAYNNATADARAVGRESDAAYIFERFLFHRHLSSLCQDSDLEEIQAVVSNKDFNKMFEALKKAVSK